MKNVCAKCFEHFHTYENVRIIKIIFPIWSYFSLSANIPNIQLDVFRDDAFYIETLKQSLRRHFAFSLVYLRRRYVRDIFGGKFLQADKRFALNSPLSIGARKI